MGIFVIIYLKREILSGKEKILDAKKGMKSLKVKV